MFCHGCWNSFVRECNVSPGAWEWIVAENWRQDINLKLEFDGEHDGTPQEARLWN